MREETRERVAAAIRELYYAPNAHTLAMRSGRTGIVGVLISGLLAPVDFMPWSLTPPMLKGINSGADTANNEFLMYSSWPHRRSRYTEQDFLNGHIDGLLWTIPEINDPLMERVVAAGLPVVALLASVAPKGAGFVGSDNRGGMAAVMDHLLSLGHRRIAFMGTTHASDFIDRREAYRDKLRANGIPFDEALESCALEHLIYSDKLRRTVDDWIDLPSPPTAIAAGDDSMAANIINRLTERGLRVPEDMSVTGFNDLPEAVRIGGGLTTVRQDFVEIGRTGMECLLRLIDGYPAAECRAVVPVELIERQTTAPVNQR